MDCNFVICADIMVAVVLNKITGILTSAVWLKFYYTNFTVIFIFNEYGTTN